jgi:hypothetical protein
MGRTQAWAVQTEGGKMPWQQQHTVCLTLRTGSFVSSADSVIWVRAHKQSHEKKPHTRHVQLWRWRSSTGRGTCSCQSIHCRRASSGHHASDCRGHANDNDTDTCGSRGSTTADTCGSRASTAADTCGSRAAATTCLDCGWASAHCSLLQQWCRRHEAKRRRPTDATRPRSDFPSCCCSRRCSYRRRRHRCRSCSNCRRRRRRS